MKKFSLILSNLNNINEEINIENRLANKKRINSIVKILHKLKEA